ncbi:MAG TPA: phosphate ABC transporter substrate-binding protein [Methanosphaera sp.]|nr:phosphate ABC transporter substrate-binding protein [Methanosphaera sp.]
MKIKYLIIIGIIITGLLIFTPGIDKKDNIQVVGSTSVQGICQELSEAYITKNNNTVISVQGGGSSVGLSSVIKQSTDIGMYSTDISRDKNVTTTAIAKDAIVIIVNPSNPINDLSKEDLKDIFTGKKTSWKDFGGNDEKITLVSREEGSGTRKTIKNKLLNNESISPDALIQSSTGSLIQTVSTNPNSIGFASLSEIRDNNVKILTVDNIKADKESVNNGSYPLQRPFLFLTKNPEEKTSKFIKWILSPEGQKIVEENGLIPVS